MQTTIGIDIEAPAQLVFDLAHRVDRWDRLLPHYARSRVLDRHPDGTLVVDFIARRPLIGLLGLGLPVTWRSRTWNDPGHLRLRFLHVAGATRGMDVTWWIEPTANGCHVTIGHDFRPRLPGFAAFVDRWFTRPIAGRTLATFKALAETLAADATGSAPGSGSDGVAGLDMDPESGPLPMTNIRT